MEINQALNGIEGQELMTLSLLQFFTIDTRFLFLKFGGFNVSHKKNGNYEGTYKENRKRPKF